MSTYERAAPALPNSLEALYDRYDAIASGRDKRGDSVAAHAAILGRLATNRRDAEAAGWTSLGLERDGRLGRLRLVGLAPNVIDRTVVPDSGRAIDPA
jgi:hypothetical protein